MLHLARNAFVLPYPAALDLAASCRCHHLALLRQGVRCIPGVAMPAAPCSCRDKGLPGSQSTPLSSEQTWSAGMGSRIKDDLLSQLAAMKRNKSVQDMKGGSEVCERQHA